ncbi:MAG: undecaprenyldiphospho-muramoylpentapeptide beta-N-acetylglucosaminyltransferase [Bacteroidales bacterium]|jgi:UDP-N-acetylglucosamine--N-acetylmuramyl-(pentapeptide) pyrophosphoryl-undecaprenol N-acetylglucosamine transferase|nr:undecaprenyldiphospho-muramoylpentapeptide beta-N-acetylglucosaminyltransferase [Bacteroidales bacterium]
MKVIISGGGSGGHIFPAIAIANAIRAKYADSDILFIGANKRMEMEKVPLAGYKIEGLPISGLQRRLTWKNILFPFKVVLSLIKAKRIIKKFNPDIAIGVGGYASAPTLKQASKLNIPTIIQEQNSYPGITNKILSKKANKICVAYDNMERWFEKDKICFTGNPVRQNVIDIKGKETKAYNFFKLEENKTTILAIGGSLGALTINQSIDEGLKYFVDNNIQLIWQTGKNYYNKAKESISNINSDNIKVFEFIYDMDLAYSAADIIISRAGAMAISELSLIGKPTILIPSPNVAEDHQTKNATALVNKDAAIMVKDVDARENLITTLNDLINDKNKQKTLSDNIVKLGIKDADSRIVEIVEELILK